ncbi:MAG TPA: adenylate/guanylate cyclase domain-containing protein [Stellaceae bacterium]|nr:adenylate/guanylate cyclase domain-containing protein [Stellaceae bacterium]
MVLGRPREGVAIDIDLSPDLRVSRPHARVWSANGRYWIEDLGSANGTLLDDETIPARTPVALRPGQAIKISATTLVLETSSDDATVVDGLMNDAGDLGAGAVDPDLAIIEVIDATAGAFDADHPIEAGQAQHMVLMYQLPLQFEQPIELEALLQATVEQLVAMIPSASRGALLITDSTTDELLLKAHVPVGEPSVSTTLARRAMARRQGFIWCRANDPSLSQIVNRMEAGMYVPLISKGEVVGVACIDNDDRGMPFTVEDLRVVLAAAHLAALAVTQNRLRAELRHSATLLSRLLTNFSPKTREHLLAQAHHGRLRLGGERSEVVVLISDIRGFTQLTAQMDADEVVDLLNDYFSALVDAIFIYDGTVDKYVGDSILAVFGSPEADPQRHEKAVRAALAMQAAAHDVSLARSHRGLATCKFGIGLHCGDILHGFIGSSDRMELTVIGDAVNWATRYCDAAAPDEILISPALHQHIWSLINAERASIQTKHEGTLLAYRLRGLKRQRMPLPTPGG